jgi:hypothetical protein
MVGRSLAGRSHDTLARDSLSSVTSVASGRLFVFAGTVALRVSSKVVEDIAYLTHARISERLDIAYFMHVRISERLVGRNTTVHVVVEDP